jgi:glycolate oxidase iron-sulfur subunit
VSSSTPHEHLGSATPIGVTDGPRATTVLDAVPSTQRPVGGAPDGPLAISDDDLVSCVACGLCLPHCPTYRVTGLETSSPRGRIAAMRAVQFGGAPIDATFERYMEECIQCRGCEAACPSQVPYGRLAEGARDALHRHRRRARTRRRRLAEWLGYSVVLPRHRLVVAASFVLGLAQRLRLVPKRLVPRGVALPQVSLAELRRPLRPTARPAAVGEADGPSPGSDAWLFTGCVMDAWQRGTHRSALAVLEAAGASVRLPGRGGDCCGALHVHAGRTEEARRLAERVMASMPGDAPIVVDSAGCGAAMKDYGHLVGGASAQAFAARVHDFAEWLQPRRDRLSVRDTHERVVVQDPCHLRHVQRQTTPVRSILAGSHVTVDTDDDGLCCGAGGAFSALQPDLALAARDRKVAALRRAVGGAALAEFRVVSANPGCSMHLGAAGVQTVHPADLLAEALDARDQPDGPPETVDPERSR